MQRNNANFSDLLTKEKNSDILEPTCIVKILLILPTVFFLTQIESKSGKEGIKNFLIIPESFYILTIIVRIHGFSSNKRTKYFWCVVQIYTDASAPHSSNFETTRSALFFFVVDKAKICFREFSTYK